MFEAACGLDVAMAELVKINLVSIYEFNLGPGCILRTDNI